MIKSIIGKKLVMTRIFNQNGRNIPVTLIEAGPCTITHIIKTAEGRPKAVQIGFGKSKHLTKPLLGHLKKSKSQCRFLKEVMIGDDEVVLGSQITVDNFQIGDLVNISGISKGKGFAGTVKRHGFRTGPKTHGSNNYRQPGSIGCGYPERVIKGKRMAGHLGNKQITCKKLPIVDIDREKNILLVKGGVPGIRGNILLIKSVNE